MVKKEIDVMRNLNDVYLWAGPLVGPNAHTGKNELWLGHACMRPLTPYAARERRSILSLPVQEPFIHPPELQ